MASQREPGMKHPQAKNAAGNSTFRVYAEPDPMGQPSARDQDIAKPVMIRAYSGVNKGATAFFRNRPFLRTLATELGQRCPERPRVFFHACSIGAEPYSLAIWYLNDAASTGRPAPAIFATDIAPAFLEMARAAQYPRSILTGMTDKERRWFEPAANGLVRVSAAVRKLVEFAPPQSFMNPLGGDLYDAVLAMNALTYVTPAEQTQAIRTMAGSARHLLGLTAFHPDTIRADIESIGFAPVLAGQREIHGGWGDRCVAVSPPAGTPEYSWQLQHFDTALPDREFRYCSLFARKGTA